MTKDLPLPPGVKVVMQANFISIDCMEYIAVTSHLGLHLYDACGDQLIATLKIDDIPINPDCTSEPSRAEFCCGVDGVHGTPMIALGSSQGTVAICYFSERKKKLDVEHSLVGHRRPICSVHCSVSHIVSGDESGHVVVWSSSSFEQQCHFPSMGHPCSAVCIRADTVIAAFSSGVIRVYRLSKGRLEIEIDAHCRALNALDVHPQDDVFASVGEDGFLNVWLLPDKANSRVRLKSSVHLANNLLVGISFLKDGSGRIGTSSYDRKAITLHKI